MEHFWDLLFQLVKHGTNTLHVAFIFLFSIYSIKPFYSRIAIVGLLTVDADCFGSVRDNTVLCPKVRDGLL